MLKEISCEKFLEDGKVRKPIKFHPGLNTIIGDSNGSNSIGKSTLMMIIDFCFGGDDYYRKETDAINHVGHHEIKFEFEFEGVSKYFIRSTNEPTYVYVCDKDYNKISKITNDAFKAGLAKYYKIDNPNLTLRGYLSPYFRVYNRGTHNEYRPLNASVREADASGISCLLMMYGQYTTIKDLSTAYETAIDKKKEYDNLKRFNIAPIASNADEKEKMEKELAELRIQLEELNRENRTGTAEADLLQNQMKKALLSQRKKLRRQRDALINQKNDIKEEEDYNKKSYARQYEELLRFFPNINIKTIEEVDAFHKSVGKIMKKESEENNVNIDSMVALLDTQIAEIDEKLKEFKEVPNVTDEVLKKQTYLIESIKTLETAIKNFDLRTKANESYNTAKTTLDSTVKSRTTSLETRINTELSALNAVLREKDKEKRFAPVLNINSLTSYAFYIPNDTGTGSRYKAVCLLDLTLLKQTSLPIFVHDSIMYTNIENDTCKDLFKLYVKQTTKQIIVGIDNPEKYNDVAEDGTVFNLTKENKVIELSKHTKALFGTQWNIESKNPETK